MGTFERSVFGTEDETSIDRLFVDAAADVLGLEVRRVAWRVYSVAAVVGLELGDGSVVVARAYQPNVTAAFLDATIRVQDAARVAGLPAAEPLTAATPTAWGLVRFERELPDPGVRGLGDDELDISADGLARQVEAARAVDPRDLDAHPMASTDDLYPIPHSPIFDFEATAAGAEWIDEIAAAARRVRDADTEPSLVHGDWSARNIRVEGGRITAIFDWESVSSEPETWGVGVAATTWRSTGEPGDEAIAPDADDLRRYLAAYEAHRPEPFTESQRRAALGAAVYCLAYSARCEHALRPSGREGRARTRLDLDGAALLALLEP